ncbi:MAG: hypothetical protein WCJ63_07105, partial [Actinomycetes bacterium]
MDIRHGIADSVENRRKLLLGGAAALVLAIVLAGLICGDDAGRGAARDYSKVWATQDFNAMYKRL